MSENELIELDNDDGGGEVLVAVVPLTPKEEAFVRAYADPESATYGKATKSAEVARYSEPHNAAYKLRRRPRIIARIGEYEELTRVVIGKVLADLEHERQLALEKGDLATAVRASELMGKHLGMFLESSVVTLNQANVGQYDEREARATMKLTALLLMNPQYGAVDAVGGTSPASQDGPGATPTVARGQSIEAPARAMVAEIAALEAARPVPQAPQQRQERE